MDDKSFNTDDLNSVNDAFEDTDYMVPLSSALSIEARKKIESTFYEFMKKCKQDKNLKKYSENFEEIFNALNLVLENEERLLNTIESLQINKHEQVINDAVRQSLPTCKRERELSIEKYQIEEKKSNKVASFLVTSELKAQNEKLIEQHTKLIYENEQLLEKVHKAQDLEDEYNRLQEEYNAFTDQMTNENSTLKVEIQRLNRKIENFEHEIKHLNDKLEEKDNVSSMNLTDMKTLETKLNKTEANLKEMTVNQEKLRKELNIQSLRFQKSKQEHDCVVIKYEELLGENKRILSDLKQTEISLHNLKNDCNQLQRHNEGLCQKVAQAKECELETKNRDRFRLDRINDLEKNVQLFKEKCETLERDSQKQKSDFVKTLTLLAKSRNETKKQLKNVNTLRDDLERVQSDNDKLKFQIKTLKKQIGEAEVEITQEKNEVIDFSRKLLSLIDELKTKEIFASMIEQKLSDSMKKIRHITRLYESVRGDRNFNAQKLIEFKEDNIEMKKQLAMLNNEQIHLTKARIRSENEVANVKIELTKIEHQRDKLRSDVDHLSSELKNSNNLVSNLSKEHKNLLKLIENSDSDKRLIRRELEKLFLERNTIGSQLIRRNDEISLLYEKIRILVATLNRGEKMYSERCEEISILKKEIRSLRRKEYLHSKTCNENLIQNAQKELIVSEKALLKEQAKVKALEDSRTTWNIHRWRALQITDPNQYELIEKCNLLQKRLIEKSKQLAQTELTLQQQVIIFKELEKSLERRMIFNETHKLILDYEKKVKEKTRKIQSLTAENIMLAEKLKQF